MDSPHESLPEVFITTDCKCTVNLNITTPLHEPYFFKNVSLNRHEIYNITFDKDIKGGPGTLLNNKSIEIKSDEEIIVYAANMHVFSTAAFTVFPVDTLGDNYFVITWQYDGEFIIVATEENTNINVAFAKGASTTYNSTTYTTEMPLDITMNKYQIFHVNTRDQDFTGTRITSNEPIAVISGAYCIWIHSGSCHHMSSQMTPVKAFGNSFVTINMLHSQSPLYFKILAIENDTDVYISGMAPVTFAGPDDSYLFRISNQSSKIVSSNKAIAIALFTGGWSLDYRDGGATMIILPHTQQFANEYTFTTINYPEKPFQNSLTIVINELDIGGLQLDGQTISANWIAIDECNNLQRTDINVTDGVHTVNHVNHSVTFLAVSMGIATSNAYGYPSGLRFAPIKSVSN